MLLDFISNLRCERHGAFAIPNCERRGAAVAVLRLCPKTDWGRKLEKPVHFDRNFGCNPGFPIPTLYLCETICPSPSGVNRLKLCSSWCGVAGEANCDQPKGVPVRHGNFPEQQYFRVLFLLNLPGPIETIGQPHPLPGKVRGMPIAAHPDVCLGQE